MIVFFFHTHKEICIFACSVVKYLSKYLVVKKLKTENYL